MTLQVGQPVPEFTATDIFGSPVSPSDYRGRKLMIAFFRFAACPYCNLRVHELTAKQSAYRDRLNILTVFQSPAETLQRHTVMRRLPFTQIADPDMRLFGLFDGELSWAKFISGHVFHVPQWFQGVGKGAFSAGARTGDLRLVPADFLIDEEGIVQRAHYGRDVTDHMPLREISAWVS
jgi:peroxiredoxin